MAKSCCVKGCSESSRSRHCVVSFHKFPRDETLRAKWCEAIGYTFTTKNPGVCSKHFRRDDFRSTMLNTLKKDAVPNLGDNKLDVHPGPSHIQERTKAQTRTHVSREEDPQLSEDTNQCRFCGEFSNDCTPVHQTHLAKNKTKLAFNDINVSLDFDDDALPKTVCSACDAKLQEMHDFVKAVKSAQDVLIISLTEEEVIETLLAKTEYEETEEDDDDDDKKDNIIDLITVGETEFIKEIKTLKRKSNTELKSKKSRSNADLAKKPKKSLTKVIGENEKERTECVIDITEEYIDREDEYNIKDNFASGDTNTDVAPSELELAISTLVSNLENDKGNS